MTDIKRARKVCYYGDEEMSDAVFVVRNTDFYIHSKFLSVRSTFFKELFTDNPPIEGRRISIIINEDPTDFKFMLNMIYKQFYGEYNEPDLCPCIPTVRLDDDALQAITAEWQSLARDMRLAERYKVLKIVKPILERYAALKCCEKSVCTACAGRNLTGLYFNWKSVIPRMKTSVETFAIVLTALAADNDIYLPVFRITPTAIRQLLDRILGAKNEKLKIRSESNAPNDDQPRQVYYYGRRNVVKSDVVLLGENAEFHVHKQFLSVYSPVFSTMFFKDYIETKEKSVPVYDDIPALKAVLDILYYGQIEDDEPFLTCSRDMAEFNIIRFWRRFSPIMKLFDYYDLPLRLIEDLLKASWCGDDGCVECASKRLFAMHHKLQNVKEKIPFDSVAMVSCLRKFEDILPVPLLLTPDEFITIMRKTKDMA